MESLTPSAISRTTSIGFPASSRSSSVDPALLDTSSYSTSRVPTSNLPCFARVPEYDDQASVYAFIGPRMYGSVMAGYNSCLFAYGQTGSGKTHSVIGPPECIALHSSNRGIVPRLCEDLFEMMRKEREEDETVSYSVECSFLEIYCERVRDLLVHNSSGGGGHGNGCNNSSNNNSTSLGGGGGGGGGNNASLQSLTSTAAASLRIRQHPTRGPYVEGLALVKVRDANAVMKHLTAGLRERVTAETKMNEHSSRSHALLQLHITRVMVVREETAMVTKTRVCKVNLVDLAGSERVTQSGASGERFEEARNINLSLTTLGRVILQLTDKQAGKHVIPGYRDSVLTWLLSDSLGGNSKTIMLATIAPSAYCYHQTLNTLRFAGLTKKVVNVATVNEDRHFQKLIATLRQQIVRLTLQLEEGKAAEVYHDEIRALQSHRDELEAQIDSMRATMSTMVPATEAMALQRRVADLEETNGHLLKEKNQLQRQLLTTTTTLREELVQKREEIMKLHESLGQKETEIQEWARRCRAGTLQSEASLSQQCVRQNGMLPSQFPHVIAGRSRRHEELERQLNALKEEVKAERKRAEVAVGAQRTLQAELETLRQKYDDNVGMLESAQRRLAEKSHALEVTQSELMATKTMLRFQRSDNSAAERESELVAQLEQTQKDYLSEKQTNVDLLMRVSEVERQATHMRKELSAKALDINELEHLLLEETETSERYYIQARYNHDVFAITMSFACKFFYVCKGPYVLTHTRDFYSGIDYGQGDVAAFMWEQSVCECVRVEACDRALLEQECLTSLVELLNQKTLLHELAAAATAEESKRLRHKLEYMEAVIEKEERERLVMEATLRGSESARDRLSRQVENMTEQLERLQQSNDALIQKIVEAQSSQDVLSLHSSVADDMYLLQAGEKEGKPPREGRRSEEQKERQKQEQVQARQEREIAHYQEQLGVLRAQLEKERHDRAEGTRAMEREREKLKQETRRVRDECRASLKESTQIVRDYEVHLKELQETITTLRSALEEECNNADRAQDEMRRVEIEKREALEELRHMTASRDAFQASYNDSEQRFSDLHQQIQDLHVAYGTLERQLSGMSLPAADVYLTIDREDGNDSGNSWIEKAMREKEVLEQQKRDVQRLNEELLATVRLRNQSLRDVHRQITKMQRGGVSPDMADAVTPNDNSPLGAQLGR